MIFYKAWLNWTLELVCILLEPLSGEVSFCHPRYSEASCKQCLKILKRSYMSRIKSCWTSTLACNQFCKGDSFFIWGQHQCYLMFVGGGLPLNCLVPEGAISPWRSHQPQRNPSPNTPYKSYTQATPSLMLLCIIKHFNHRKISGVEGRGHLIAISCIKSPPPHSNGLHVAIHVLRLCVECWTGILLNQYFKEEGTLYFQTCCVGCSHWSDLFFFSSLKFS